MGFAMLSPRVTLPHQGKFNAAEKLNFMSLTVTYPIYAATGITIWFFAPAFVSLAGAHQHGRARDAARSSATCSWRPSIPTPASGSRDDHGTAWTGTGPAITTVTDAVSAVSIVIPSYNEEASIAATIARVSAAARAAGIPHEILAVNDGSRDRDSATSSGPCSRPSPNCGWSSTFRTGATGARCGRASTRHATSGSRSSRATTSSTRPNSAS